MMLVNNTVACLFQSSLEYTEVLLRMISRAMFEVFVSFIRSLFFVRIPSGRFKNGELKLLGNVTTGLLNDKLKAHILIVSETKIDGSYPDDQFSLQGYRLYRKDRAKGGGGDSLLISLQPYSLRN